MQQKLTEAEEFKITGLANGKASLCFFHSRRQTRKQQIVLVKDGKCRLVG